MTQPSYNLIDEPWIPALEADGVTPAAVGLRAALHRAHQLRGLYGESPLVVASLYRLLLALLYAIFGEPTQRSWARLWEAGAFPQDAVDAYLERWHARFDLFHPERPFYQWPPKANREKLVTDMIPDMASGNAATLFDHHSAQSNAFFSPAASARALLLVQTFSVSGGSGLAPKESKDAPWARGCVFLVEGENLFQTLMLNFMSASISGITDMDDSAFWEKDDPFASRSTPLGMKDYLTWPTRAIHLLPEQEGDGRWRVCRVRMGSGLKLDAEVIQPFYHYRKRPKDGKLLFQRFNEGRALWRDSASFLRLRDENHHPPRTLHWLANQVAEGVLESHRVYRYMVLGMASGRIDTDPQGGAAKIHFYREEHFPLPARYLLEPALVERLSQALNDAESVRSKLGRSLSRLATLMLSPTADQPDGHKPDKKEVQNLMAHWAAERAYWASLEVPFFHLVQALPEDADRAMQTWQQTLKDAARQALESAIRMAGENARARRAAVRARGQLEGGLKDLFTVKTEKGEVYAGKDRSPLH